MSKGKRPMISVYIIILLFLGVACYITLSKRRNGKNLKQNMALTSGKVYGFPTDGRGQAIWVEYTYSVKGKTYTRMNTGDKVFKRYAAPFVNKTFPVVYDSLNPSNARILILPEHFKEFNLWFPDSLAWVRVLK